MIDFKLPTLGPEDDEGILLEWRIKPGDEVRKGQVVAVVDTAKAAIDVEIWQEGTVYDLLAKLGDTMPVGTVMARLLAPGEEAPASPPPAVASVAAARQKVSPAARKRANELHVALETVIGTGPQGSVTLEDVEKVASESPANTVRPAGASPAGKAADKAAEMRQAIANAMARSKREIPHYYLSESIPMAKALAWLQSENARRTMAERLLPATLLLKAVAMSLKQFSEFNGFYRDGYVPASGVHVGVAISLRTGGLVAPAILNCDALSLTTLMQTLADLVRRTRAGELKSSEIAEASITVTNLGDEGCDSVFGVIYPPQVALVGFGRVAERPWVEEGALKVMPVVVASLSADHRVSDGHRGALFLLDIRERLQHPEELA